MAALSITASSVVAGSNANRDTGTAGETITAGQTVFLNTATNRWMLSDNNGTGTRTVKGIALNGASANQPLAVLKDGDITIGATLTAGTAYYLGATAGTIVPVADLDVGMDPILIGVAKSTTVLTVSIQDPGVTL